jgi:hypothetical protein
MATPAACAIASMISTPGMIGLSGKCPRRKGSLAETSFSATTESSDTSSTRSISSIG